MSNTIFEEVNKQKLIQPGDSLVIAVSGGPDSMMLLDLMNKLREQNLVNNLKLNVAHVNHRTRGKENIYEEQLIRDYCSENEIPFHKTDFIKHDKGNFHEQARLYRYNFFKKVANETKSNKLLLAHHEDDQIETILFRIIRGSTLEGYTGMKQVIEENNIKIVRPLINITKSEIINYCYEFNVPYAVDTSNKSNKYTRNKLRNSIIKELKEIQPRLNHKLLQLKTYIEEASDFVNVNAMHIYETCKLSHDQNHIALSIKQIRNNHIAVQRNVIFYAINEITNNKLELTHDKSNIIINMITNERPNLEIDLGDGYKCTKAYEKLIFFKGESVQKGTSDISLLPIDREGKYQINKDLEISVNIITDIEKRNNKTLILCYNSIEWPLYIRTRKNGDRIKIKSGHKKLKDLFIDYKIPKYERDYWPLLVNQAGEILWVIGLKQAYIEVPDDQEHYIKVETL